MSKNIYFAIGFRYGYVPIVDPETIRKILELTPNGNRNQIGSLLLNNHYHTMFFLKVHEMNLLQIEINLVALIV